MKSNLPYQLFTSSKCSCCEEVISYLKTKKITLTITNVDKDKYVLPFSLLLFPALVLGNKLIGYGFKDIVAKLKTN
jgi:glutaredoxin